MNHAIKTLRELAKKLIMPIHKKNAIKKKNLNFTGPSMISTPYDPWYYLMKFLG